MLWISLLESRSISSCGNSTSFCGRERGKEITQENKVRDVSSDWEAHGDLFGCINKGSTEEIFSEANFATRCQRNPLRI